MTHTPDPTPLTAEQLDDLRHGAAPAHGTPTQTEQDLAASLRITAGQVTRAREHLAARITDLEETERRRQQDARVLAERAQYGLAVEHLQHAAHARAARLELVRVLTVLT